MSFYEEMMTNQKKHKEKDQQKQLELKKRKEEKQVSWHGGWILSPSL